MMMLKLMFVQNLATLDVTNSSLETVMVKECYLLGKPGDWLPGRVHSLLVRECCLPGRPGNCPAQEISLSANERVQSTGEAWQLPAWRAASLPV